MAAEPGRRERERVVLAVTSSLSIGLSTVHVAEDIVRGFDAVGAGSLTAVAIFAVWLYATLMLAERPIGYVIVLLGSLLGVAIPVIHIMGSGMAAVTAGARGALFFTWTMLALGVTTLVSIALAARGLWEAVRLRSR